MPSFSGVPFGGENKRYRANITPDQSAYIGNLRFGPGQLLPVGSVEYQVYGWHDLDPGEGQPDGVKGLVYSITVPVGTSRAEIEEAVFAFAELALADPEWEWQMYDDNNGLGFFDNLNEPPTPEPTGRIVLLGPEDQSDLPSEGPQIGRIKLLGPEDQI